MDNGADRLATMVERIKNARNGLGMEVGGELKLAEEYCRDKIKLSDDLATGMIMFQ